MSDTEIKRGRKPMPISEAAPEPFTPEETAQLENYIDTAKKVDAAVSHEAALHYELGRLVGQVQTHTMQRNLSEAARLMLFKRVKEHKEYKGMRVSGPDDSIRILNTFEDFCEHMGTSRRKIDEDLQNLAVLGEELLTSMQSLGMGYRDFRKLRALPEDDRTLVIESEAVKANDPEALKDLLEELAAKRAKDREALAEAKATADAKDKVLAKKSKDFDAVSTELAKLKSLTPDAETALRIERDQEALQTLHREGFMLLGQFGKYLAKITAILNDPNVSQATAQRAMDVTSGLFSQMANETLEAGVDIDFRILAYPLTLGDIELRGIDNNDATAEGGVS